MIWSSLKTRSWCRPCAQPTTRALIDAWTVLPDYVSVNLSEPGIEKGLALLVRRGVGLEAGISTPEDARYLLTLSGVPWLRLLLEP